ncbi:MAG: response regulator [Desulfatitalea sp.]
MSEKMRVLLVEDNPGDADLIREMLPAEGEAGFSIHRVVRLSDAVRFLGQEKADLALLDLGLPDSDGIDTIRVVRRAAPNIPIVVLTGNDDEQVGMAAVRDGAQDYLLKGQTPAYHLSRVLRYAVHRKNAEEQMRESERLLRSTLDALSTHIAILDPSGRIVTVNKAWKEFAVPLRTEAIALLGNGDEMPVHSVQGQAAGRQNEFAAGIRAVLQGEKEFFEMEYTCATPSGPRWFHGRVTPFTGSGPCWVVVAHEDITAAKQAEEEKAHLTAQLRQTQKMEAIGTLAGGIAHDFNNILSAIIGFTELCLGEAAKGTSMEANLREVYQAGIRAKDLVKQILAFAWRDDGQAQHTQIGEIAREVLTLMRSLIPSSIGIRTAILSDAYVMANPSQIHQLFMNLCTNAAQAMQADGGELCVRVAEADLDPGDKTVLSELKPGRYVTIEVSDTGIGIPADKIDKIFDPYFTTKERGEGTGLGLAMVLSIVQRCHGEVKVRSQVGEGTVFTVLLPVSQKGLGIETFGGNHLHCGTERVLFVDDEPSIVKMGHQTLGRLGYQVTALQDSRDALAAIQAGPHDFDLVITDMTMPHMTGDCLAQEIFNVNPRLPVILCTGYSKKMVDGQAAFSAVKAILMKPVSIGKLAATIRKVIDDARRS